MVCLEYIKGTDLGLVEYNNLDSYKITLLGFCYACTSYICTYFSWIKLLRIIFTKMLNSLFFLLCLIGSNKLDNIYIFLS